MRRHDGTAKAAGVLNAVAAVIFVAVTTFLVFAGYRGVTDVVSMAAGALAGGAVAVLATSSRRFGRSVAALLLALFAVAAVAVVLTTPRSVVGLLEKGSVSGTVVRGLMTGFFIVVFWRLLGLEAGRRPRDTDRGG